MKVLCYDLEIKTPVHEHPMGWEGARSGACGISALVVHDSDTRRFHVYGEQTLEEAMDHLNTADLLASFNGLAFDGEVLAGVLGRFITVPQYDILDEVWGAIGGRKKGYKLDQIAKATLDMHKGGNGEFATTLVKEGRWAELFDYCIQDVHLVRELLNHIVDVGWIKGADGMAIQLPRPFVEDCT
jgi:hypothetical protein